MDFLNRQERRKDRTVVIGLNRSVWVLSDAETTGAFLGCIGFSSLFFLLHRCRDMDLNTIVGFFSTAKQENDIAVNEFIRKYFPQVGANDTTCLFLLGRFPKVCCSDELGEGSWVSNMYNEENRLVY